MGDYTGTTIGVIKGNTRSSDHGSYRNGTKRKIAVRGIASGKKILDRKMQRLSLA